MSCELEIKSTHRAATVRETSVLEIREVDALTSIKLNSASMPMLVTNKRVGTVSVFVDGSTDGRWDISSVESHGTAAADDLRIILDKATGRLTASRLATSGGINTVDTADGTCKQLGSKVPGA